MKKILWAISLILISVSTSSARADWQKVIDCNDEKLVIDQDQIQGHFVYQMVVRSDTAVARFLSMTGLNELVNSKGELIVSISQMHSVPGALAFLSTQPISSSRSGDTNNLQIQFEAQQAVRVSLVDPGPNSPNESEVWYFDRCQRYQ